MRIALTGATGFIGRYLVEHLEQAGHLLRCWCRPTSDRNAADPCEWIVGSLGEPRAADALVEGCEALVHAALDRPGAGFRGAEGDLVSFVETNVVGSLRLFEAARRAGVERIVFLSTCAVHERILEDRPLNETHPTWPTSHYGAHKAAIEQFVHSMGFGEGYAICALRPSGVYGLARPAQNSKWYGLIRDVVEGSPVTCNRGGKEVHALDVARAVQLLLEAPADAIRGEAFNCCDRYISDWAVAHLARDISGSSAEIGGQLTAPKNQIVTAKITGLGMTFGGEDLLRRTVEQLVTAVRQPGGEPI